MIYLHCFFSRQHIPDYQFGAWKKFYQFLGFFICYLKSMFFRYWSSSHPGNVILIKRYVWNLKRLINCPFLQASSQSMPWLADLVQSSEGSLDVLPVQCLCEFLLHDAADEVATTEEEDEGESKEQRAKKRQVRLYLIKCTDMMNGCKSLKKPCLLSIWYFYCFYLGGEATSWTTAVLLELAFPKWFSTDGGEYRLGVSEAAVMNF